MGALDKTDPEIAALIREEERYELETLRLIPSENYASAAVLEASGSVLTNKYSEGYPGRRYYEGQRRYWEGGSANGTGEPTMTIRRDSLVCES